MTCADATDRIVDRLYGELPESERSAFEAHLQSCDSCRRELEGYQSTRQSLQLALRGPLSQPAPGRVRDAVMQAAALRVQTRQAVSAPPAKGEARVLAALRDWLRRPWFFPAFVAASLIAVFFIAKPVLMDGPDRFLRERLSQPAPAARATVTSAPEPAAQAALPPPAPQDDQRLLVPADKEAAAEQRGRTVQMRTESLRKSAEHKGAIVVRRPAAAKKKAERAAPAPELSPAKADLAEAPAEIAKPVAYAAAPPAPAPAAAPASPPAARDQAVPRQVMENYQSGVHGGVVGGVAGGGRGAQVGSVGARAKSQAPAAEPPSRRFAEAPPPRRYLSPTAAPILEGDADDGLRKQEQPALASQPLGLPALLDRADRAFKEGRWQDAATDYRELLLRFPSDARSKLWRQRLDQASRAAAARK